MGRLRYHCLGGLLLLLALAAKAEEAQRNLGSAAFRAGEALALVKPVHAAVLQAATGQQVQSSGFEAPGAEAADATLTMFLASHGGEQVEVSPPELARLMTARSRRSGSKANSRTRIRTCATGWAVGSCMPMLWLRILGQKIGFGKNWVVLPMQERLVLRCSERCCVMACRLLPTPFQMWSLPRPSI